MKISSRNLGITLNPDENDILEAQNGFMKVGKAEPIISELGSMPHEGIDIETVAIDTLNCDFSTKRIEGANENEFINLKTVANPLYAHMRAVFHRNALSKNNLGETSSGGDVILSHRARLQVNNVLTVKTHIEPVLKKSDIHLAHPIALSVLSSSKLRDLIFDFLTRPANIESLVQLIIGKTGKSKCNDRRITFERLCRWVKSCLTADDTALLVGEDDTLMNVTLVCARIIKEIIEQFKWEYEAITVEFYQKPAAKLASIQNLKSIYTEGWISLNIGNDWITDANIKPSDTVYSNVLEDVLVSSIAKLKIKLIPLNVIDKRCDDVLFAAKLQALVNAGFAPAIKNDTLLNFMMGSSAIQEIARWWPIVKEVFCGDTTFLQDLSNKSMHVGDVTLLNGFAEEFLVSVTSHPRIMSEAAGEYLKMLNIEHWVLDERSERFHTHVFGTANQDLESRTLIEINIAENMYNVTPIGENDAWQSANINLAKTMHHRSMMALAELDRLETFGNLSAFDEPEKIWAKGEYVLTVTNVHADDLLMLCLLNTELLVRYTSTADSTLVNTINIIDWHFIVRNMQDTTAAPFTLGMDETYTQSPLLVLASLAAKSGSSKAGVCTLGITKPEYFFTSLKSAFTRNNVKPMETVFTHKFNLKANDNSMAPVNLSIDTSKYLLISKTDTTLLFSSPELIKLYRQIVYGLDVCCTGNAATMVDLKYEAERIKANVITALVDSSLQVPFVNQVAQATYYQVAESTSGRIGSWSVAFHNLQSRANCLAFAIAANLVLTGADAPMATRLVQTFNRNRLVHDYVYNKIK